MVRTNDFGGSGYWYKNFLILKQHSNWNVFVMDSGSKYWIRKCKTLAQAKMMIDEQIV